MSDLVEHFKKGTFEEQISIAAERVLKIDEEIATITGNNYQPHKKSLYEFYKKTKGKRLYEAKKSSLLREKSNEAFFCKECGKNYNGYEINILEGFGSEGSKYYVSLRYCCPERHVDREEKSRLFNHLSLNSLIWI